MYEDPRVELAAFPSGCRVLAIASAGDTVAALAAAGHRVTAVDLNPVQLRYAAGRLAGAPPRRGQAERLLAAGRDVLRTVAPAWRPARLAPFLRLTDPADQIAWWDEYLDRSALRLLLRPLRHAALVVRPGLAAAVPDRFDAVLRDRLRDGLSRHPNATNPYLRRLVLGPDPGGPGRQGTAREPDAAADPSRPGGLDHPGGDRSAVPAGSAESAGTPGSAGAVALAGTPGSAESLGTPGTAESLGTSGAAASVGTPGSAAVSPRTAGAAGATAGAGTGGVRFVLADVVEQLRAVPAGRYDGVTLSNVADGTTVHFRRRLVAALRHGVRPGGPVVLRGFGATRPLEADLGWRDRTEVDRCPLWGTVSVGTVR
jgi:hypothetical protein